jgi:hypothetical protein
MASSWVLQKVMDIRHIVGLSCEGFEGELMALLTTIETSHNLEGWVSTSKSAIRSKRVKKIAMLHQLLFSRWQRGGVSQFVNEA